MLLIACFCHLIESSIHLFLHLVSTRIKQGSLPFGWQGIRFNRGLTFDNDLAYYALLAKIKYLS